MRLKDKKRKRPDEPRTKRKEKNRRVERDELELN